LSLVLDSSTTLAWAYEDEEVPFADAVFGRLRTDGAWVPSIWPLEIANALLVGERRRRLAPANTEHLLESLASLPIEIERVDRARVWGGVVAIARAQGLTAYDAAYLDLAMRMGLALATLDTRLRTAAERVGVSLVAEEP